jgi:DNA-binding CsgD family transcriptional regulator
MDFTYRMRYLGFGLYWAWMTTFWSGTARSPLGLPSVEQQTTARIAVQAATAVTFIVAALLARRFMTSSGERVLVLGGMVLGPLGTVLAALAHARADSAPGYAVSSWVMLGIACACITLLWGRFFAVLGLRYASVMAPLSLFLAAVAGLVLGSMQPVAVLIVTTLLPIASVSAYLLARKAPPPPSADDATPRARSSGTLWRVILAIGVYGATLGFYLNSNTVFPQSFQFTAAGKIVVLAVPLLVIALLRRNDFGFVFRIALPLTAAGFLLLPMLSAEAGWIGVAVVAAGGTFVDICTWIALSDIAHRGRHSAIYVFGFGRAANAGGIAIGWATSYALLGTTPTDPSPMLAFSLVMVFVLILTTTLIVRDQDFSTRADVRPASLQLSTAESERAPGRWRRSCAVVASAHNLSAREEEVMVLLAKGRSMKFIQSDLVISYHTAKAHANHIYRKLGVHSREELIDLVEGEKRHELAEECGTDGWSDALDLGTQQAH